MIIKLRHGSQPNDIEQLKGLLDHSGIPYFYASRYGLESFILLGLPNPEEASRLKTHPAIAEIDGFDREYPLSSRAFKHDYTTFNVRDSVIGGSTINVIAGPCSVESEKQIFDIAEKLSNMGVRYLRGGAYKPRTSPYRFQGLGLAGLRLIREAADAYNMLVVTEVIDSTLLDQVYPYADILQVGSRNMQNFYFLKELGKTDKPVFLKRGMYAKVEEWLMAAEYILTEGNEKIILCERGIRTFDPAMRNTMDVAAIPLVKQLSHLPVFADPSHGTGRRELVKPLTLASIAAGADGIMVEVHPEPDTALSDSMQTLNPGQFESLLKDANIIARAKGRSLDTDANQNKETKRIDLCVE